MKCIGLLGGERKHSELDTVVIDDCKDWVGAPRASCKAWDGLMID